MSKGGGGGQVAGYKYSLGMLMGLCRGPVDEIVTINIGGLQAWAGSITDNTNTSIDAAELFGGDQKEGGVKGSLLVMMGAADQVIGAAPTPPPPDIGTLFMDAFTGATFTPDSLDFRALIGGLVSELRGVATMFFNGLICSNNPYPKPWTVRVRRAIKGWHGGTAWYPEEAIIPLTDANGAAIVAMNPAHILYECLTNPVWGRGLPTSALDETSFINAANTLCLENFGLCLAWSRTSDLAQFMQTVLNHIGGGLFTDRTTSLMTLRLLRKDYIAADLPVFDYSTGLLEIRDDQTTSPDNSHSEIIVGWVDPVTNSTRQTRVQNLAGTQANQTVTSVKVDYPGLPVADLAARVGLRDLQMQGAGIKRYTLVFDRRGRKIAPVGVFRINVPERNINNMVLRAGKVEEGSIDKQTVTVTAVQDVFGLETTTYLSEPERAWVPPDRTALVVALRSVREINYRDLVRTTTPADLAMVHVTDGGVVAVASPPSPVSHTYRFDSHAAGEAYVQHGPFTWTPTAAIGASIGHYDTSVSLSTGSGLGTISGLPIVAWIEDEIVQVTAASGGLMTIRRGCVDTLPVPHAVGSQIWFADVAQSGDGREYATGEVISVKLLTQTGSARLTESAAPEDTVTIMARQGRPYVPGDLHINGSPYATVSESLAVDAVFTWTHRDRVLQSDAVISHTDGSTGPETGVTYTIRTYNGISLLNTISGLTGDTWTYTTAMAATDGVDLVTFELEATRDGIVSYQKYHWSLFVGTAGYGRTYGLHYDH